MKHKLTVFAIALTLVVLAGSSGVLAQGPLPQAPQAALGTGFRYQGQLKKNNVAVNDPNCSMTFSLWDSQSNLSGQVGVDQTLNPVAVTSGLFTVVLNGAGQFGASAFNGVERWLQVTAQCAGDGAPVTLSRQQLTAAPYALFSAAPWVTNGFDILYGGGSVGIGPTVPLATLQVATANETNIDNTQAWDARHVVIGGTGNTGGIGLSYDQTNNVGYIEALQPANAWGTLVLNAGSYPGNGNVGIGTANPSNKLSVNGNADFSGKVGIGTTSPTATLDVTTSVSGRNAVRGQSSNGYGVYGVSVDGYGVAGVSTGLGYGVYGSSGYFDGNVAVNGKVAASHGFSGQCLSAGQFNTSTGNVCNMDMAESFASTALTEPGDLVVLAPDANATPTVRQSAHAYEGLLIGVVSTNPGLVFDNGATHLSGDNSQLITADKTVIALVGRVPVKVTMENGPIAVGDPLTSSSEPGSAMKATQPGKIIGYALESRSEPGKVLALVQPGYYLPAGALEAAQPTTELKTQVAAQQAQILDLQQQNAAVEAHLTALERATAAGSTTAPAGLSLEWLALGALGLLNGLLLAVVLVQRRGGGPA